MELFRRCGVGRRALGVGGTFFLLLVAAAAWGQELRTWTDSTGKFKIEGTLVKVEGGKALIRRKDGKQLSIVVTKLSAADQQHLRDLESESPFEEVEEGPFEPADDEAAGSGAGASAPGKEVTPDWSSAQAISLMPSREAWKFQVPLERPAMAELKNRAIPIPQKANFFEGTRALLLNARGDRALIGYTLDEPKPAGTTRLVLCDLEKGKMLGAATTSGKYVPVALHDEGMQVLMRRDEFGFGNQDRAEVWNLTPTGIAKVIQWVPYDQEQGGGRDVKWGAYLDGERLVTLGGSGKLVIWNAQTAEPLCHLPIDGGCIPALSPDRKLLAFSTGNQLGVFDLAAQEVVALQATAQTPWPKLCFSPDGTRLACLAHTKLFVWNFANGELFREIPLTGINVGLGEMIWPHDKYLLLGNSHLFDIENQVPLWAYRGQELVQQAGKLTAFVVSQGHERPGALVLSPVPSSSFEDTLSKVMKVPDFFVLKPGVTVRINVDGLPDPAERAKALEFLTKKLTEIGCEVGSQGTIDLVATTEVGEEREVSYHGFGISPFRSYKVREHLTKLAFIYKDKSTWQTQSSSIPGFIQLKEGETIEQVLRQSERPSYAFFEHVELPRRLIKPMGPDGLGASQVSISGIR